MIRYNGANLVYFAVLERLCHPVSHLNELLGILHPDIHSMNITFFGGHFILIIIFIRMLVVKFIV